MKILGVRYDNLLRSEALTRSLSFVKQSGKSNIFFLNLDCLRQACRDPEYRAILNEAALVLPDGIGLELATRIFGGRMKDNCNGTDFSPVFIKAAAEQRTSFFLLGGREGVAEKAADRLRERVPGVHIAGTYSGYFESESEMIDQINASGADVLLVAMGVPLQEKFIARHRAALNPRLCFGVGALLDYLSDTIPRAPQWMIRLHFEWLWRIFIEPRRMICRYLIDGVGFFINLLLSRLMQWATKMIGWGDRSVSLKFNDEVNA